MAIFNPCFLRGGQGYGIKVISDFYDNEKRGVVRMSGIVALFDGMSGHPYALLEAGYLTDLRTGAGTGLAARYLARPAVERSRSSEPVVLPATSFGRWQSFSTWKPSSCRRAAHGEQTISSNA